MKFLENTLRNIYVPLHGWFMEIFKDFTEWLFCIENIAKQKFAEMTILGLVGYTMQLHVKDFTKLVL